MSRVSRYYLTNICNACSLHLSIQFPIQITELISAHLQRNVNVIHHPAVYSKVFSEKTLRIISIKDLIISLSGPLHYTACLVLLVITFPTHMYSNKFARVMCF